MDKYERLCKCIKKHDPELSYERVNEEIDKMVSRCSEPTRVLESLICHCEANMGVESFPTNITIAFGLLTAGASTIASEKVDGFVIGVGMVLLIGSLAVIGIAQLIEGRDYKRKFILKCLQRRYESFQYEENQCRKKGDNTSEEHMYIVNVQKRP